MKHTNIEKFLTDRIIQNLEKDFNYYSDKLTIEPIMRISHTEIPTVTAKTLDVIRIAKYKSKEFDFLSHIKVEKDEAEKAIKKILAQQGCELCDIINALKIIGAWLNAYNSEGFYYGFMYCFSLLEQNLDNKEI